MNSDADIPEKRPWVAATVQELREAGSWGGRIHAHKLLACLYLLGRIEPPFRFDLYRYGPYSFELDETIATMETFGLLTKTYTQPGYGPKYDVTDLGKSCAQKLEPESRKVIRDLAQDFKNAPSKEWEIIATCLWVSKKESVSDEEAIIRRVHELKPHYSVEEIRPLLTKSNSLKQNPGNAT